MKRTQIYLLKDQIKKLKRLAQKKKTTLSELVREAVDVRYASGPIVSAPAKKQETLVQLAGRIRAMGFCGPKDLATDMDEYLYGEKK
ncbi:MAG: ribbon-helix-helix protein, CopG family [Candidatus Wildermuthbacteria bacterium]|nr:ribbon-helix-helix protein, CopG family [Candidatus Wildermuthbacteria bacterium]